jgi:hypothetical protein
LTALKVYRARNIARERQKPIQYSKYVGYHVQYRNAAASVSVAYFVSEIVTLMEVMPHSQNTDQFPSLLDIIETHAGITGPAVWWGPVTGAEPSLNDDTVKIGLQTVTDDA